MAESFPDAETQSAHRRACSSAFYSSAPPPERCVEAYHLQRTRFEGIAGRKLRRRQLTEDGNVEISGRDLREVTAAQRSLSSP
jgi:hypothetical protein